jgi:hypothetical protein
MANVAYVCRAACFSVSISALVKRLPEEPDDEPDDDEPDDDEPDDDEPDDNFLTGDAIYV